MHIKKLEICGFKSFVDRTVVHFEHDVIAIVGPNGCGKSNIVDAIRWCMGEQNARQLRGKSMDDVIFNGSDSRAQHGMAEVTLTFDNTDREQAASLPIEYRDYAEIAITRRLFRDGTSAYLINQVDVRLKDVVDVFLGTGVGSKAYSIVEQGKIGLIVSARPEDRRSLIEEAAGITKYKSRKKTAERKMELTEQNLLRIGDRVGELERNVASLRRQAAKAERYLSYRGEVESLVLHSASHQLLGLLAMEKYEDEQRSKGELEVASATTELDVAEASLEAAKLDALVLEERHDKAQAASYAADNDVRALEADIERARDRLQNLCARVARAEQEQQDLTPRVGGLSTERDQIAASLSSLQQQEAREAEGALEEHERLEVLRAEERAAESALGELRTRASRGAAQIAAAEAKLAGYERRIAEMLSRRDRLAEETCTLGAERLRLSERVAQLEGETEAHAENKESKAAERSEIERELGTLRPAFTQKERDLDTARGRLSQQKARLRALEELQERLEGVGVGVKHLMSAKNPTVLGLLARRLQVPDKMTAPLAGLLGDVLETVVVEDEAEGLRLLSELAAQSKGRATIVAQNVEARSSPHMGGASTVEGPGVLGLLMDHVQFAESDRALVHSILGDVLLVESIETAQRILVDHPGLRIVTLEGTVFHPDGRRGGGSGNQVAANLVEKQREIRELSTSCSELTEIVESEVEAHRVLRERIAHLGSDLDVARQYAHEAELALLSTEKDRKRCAEQLAHVERRHEQLSRELSEIAVALGEAEQEQSETSLVMSSGHTTVREVEMAMEGLMETALQWREQVADAQSVVTERKVRLARIREQGTSARTTVERLSRSVEELQTRLTRLDKELVESARETGQTVAILMNHRDASLDAVQLARQAEAESLAARTEFDQTRASLADRETLLKALRLNLADASRKLSGHELSLQRLSLEKEHVLEGVREKFRGLDLRRVVGDYHLRPPPDEEHAQRISELNHLIERMGPVNLDATREHEEESKRFVFFSEQKQDLEKALDDLRRAIAQMNRESRKLFQETFDAINSRFKVLFPKMFRGGRAELHLTNPEDLLETGVEIIAQPPGKKLGNIELMSGGEKALTAVSLIFAIFQYKPSPFCVLDEVDAPLDEANVTRYNEIIREMTDRSQFILITHIKRTMQSVDVLYGVTMQEPGVSRLVSVKMNEGVSRRTVSPPEEHVQVA